MQGNQESTVAPAPGGGAAAEAAGAAAGLQRFADYRVGREAVFPSDESLRWFIRRYRPQLVEAGALTRPTGAWLVRAAAFDQVVAEVGARRAAGN